MCFEVTLSNKPFTAEIAFEGSFARLKYKVIKRDSYVDSEVGFQVPSFLEHALAVHERTE